MKSLSAALRSLFQTYSKAPLLFLVLQLPEVSVDWIDRAFRADFEKNPLLGALTLFPYFTLASGLSTALTAIAAAEIVADRPATWNGVWAKLNGKVWLLAKASLLSGLFILLGMPVLLPAIYFMAVYLLVPLVVVLETPAPALALMVRSKNLVKPHFYKVLGFTLFFLAVGVAMFLAQGEIDKHLIDAAGYPAHLGVVVDSVFALLLGVGVNLGIFQIYRFVQPQVANSPNSVR